MSKKPQVIQLYWYWYCYYTGTQYLGLSGGRIRLDLDSSLQGYGFLTMLPASDLLNFGNTGNNHLPLSTFGKHWCFGLDSEWMFAELVLLDGKLGVMRVVTNQ